MPREGHKHLIKCRCVLPQFKKLRVPPAHQFQVFSVVDESGAVVPKVVRCNNCGILHRIQELCTSQILAKEDAVGCITVEDVKDGLDSRLAALLEREGADFATWEAVRFCLDEQRWGDVVVLSSERVDGAKQGKYLRLFGPALFRVESFVRDEVSSPQGA